MYSPFLRAWLPRLTDKPDPLACAPPVESNAKKVRDHPLLGRLFNCAVPEAVEGFELEKDDAKTLRTCWPAGEKAAKEASLGGPM